MEIIDDFFRAIRHEKLFDTEQQWAAWYENFMKKNPTDEEADKIFEVLNVELPVTSPDGVADNELFRKRTVRYNELLKEAIAKRSKK